jgi:voltage-gated potassium channel
MRRHHPEENETGAIFIALRRMRTSLLVLISSFTISISGMMLMPGVDPEGNTWRMDLFEAFYFVSYTASTIGYGEIPYPYSPQQRLWVVIAIALTVISWSYVIAQLLSLLRDRHFRGAVAQQRFARRVSNMREDFVLIVGFGDTGRELARMLDADGQWRLVVLDADPAAIAQVQLEAFQLDVPCHVADATDPSELIRAGLTNPKCAAVVATTDSDKANLAVVMAADLLTPGTPVVTRAATAAIAQQMADFGDPMVVNPYDLFGDELALAVTKPRAARLLDWLVTDAGSLPPAERRVPPSGHWLVISDQHWGQLLVQDLQQTGITAELLAVTSVHKGDHHQNHPLTPERMAGLTGFVAATASDTENLSLLRAARRQNPDLFVVGFQNQVTNRPLYERLHLDYLLVPTDLVAQEARARIGTPMMWQFVQEVANRPDSWSGETTEKLAALDDNHRPRFWRIDLQPQTYPCLVDWLAHGDAQLGDLLRDPQQREQHINAVVMLLIRQGTNTVFPAADTVLQPGDELLLAGTTGARAALQDVLAIPAAFSYTVQGQQSRIGRALRTLSGRS